jgi:protein-tyrosine phosphatase
VIDLHFHLLPGIDDGPPDLDASVELARAALATGVDTIVATPHVSLEWPNTPATILTGVRVVPGAEVALSRAMEFSDSQLRSIALAGGRCLLIEVPQAAVMAGLEAQLLHLRKRGHRIVLAHVERCPTFHEDVDLLGRLVDAGILTSLTAGALVGRLGKPLQRFAAQLIASGLIHNVASDAHDCVRRPPGLAQELADANLSDQTAWLTEDVPAAILTGRPTPPGPADWPAPATRTRRFGRLLTARH